MNRALVVLLAFVLAAPAAAAQEEIVVRGNQAYQEGNYDRAIEAYEAVLEAGYRSDGLEYNLGNAYFKAGELGRAILHWERALELAPADPDARANLELARSLTVDAVEPVPTFWLTSLLSWWVGLLPRRWLLGALAVGWLLLTGGVVTRILGRSSAAERGGRWGTALGLAIVLLFGPAMVVRETGWGVAERAVILADAVPVRSAPAAGDDLTLFEIHEGTLVRVDRQAGEWLEVILEDGKVGWIPAETLEVI